MRPRERPLALCGQVTFIASASSSIGDLHMSHHAMHHAADHAAQAPLTLSGTQAYDIQGDTVFVTCGDIANHRDALNLSGTLSLELWALSRPYTGGDFNGIALAGTQLGQLSGQYFLPHTRHALAYNAPAPGTWYLTLMLR